MNTLSVTFRFVVLGVIVMVVVVSCCGVFPTIPDPRISLYSVDIGHKQRDQYVKWKQPEFDQALILVCAAGGTYCLKAKLDNGKIIFPYHPVNSNCTNCRDENIRTVKVTKSKDADNIAAGESAVNDPNIMYRVRSPYPDNINKVLGTVTE
jgi:hypothetical protein